MRPGFWRDAALAKVLLAADSREQAADLLRALSPTSERQEVTALTLRAVANAGHDRAVGLVEAEAALAIASAEGMYQTVVAAGPHFANLIEQVSWAASEDWMHDIRRMFAKGPRGGARVAQLVVQPTERERAVARYLASRLTVPEIARELGVTPNTVKTHLKSLYRKLGVTSRDEAVTAARRFDIIG
jgi:LuxR family maltose regulon positive regulatory protein